VQYYVFSSKLKLVQFCHLQEARKYTARQKISSKEQGKT